MQFADKTTLGQATVLGLLYVPLPICGHIQTLISILLAYSILCRRALFRVILGYAFTVMTTAQSRPRPHTP